MIYKKEQTLTKNTTINQLITLKTFWIYSSKTR